MMARLGIGLLFLLGRLPLPLLRWLGALMGRLLFVVAASRRRVALRNLELCFPDVPAAKRRAWAKESFEVFCQALLDRGWLWSGSEALLRRRVKLVGALEEMVGNSPTIVFAPHFYGMDAGGLMLSLQVRRQFMSIFTAHSDPVQSAWLTAGRERFGNMRMLNRTAGVRPIISCLRQGGLLYLLPDMDFGHKDSVFVPFFAMPQTATVASLSRFARLGQAKVVALYSRMTPYGYEAELTPAWQHFPTDDVVADTVRMNRELQAAIQTMPGQYYWVHRRFKTRPEGSPSVYD